MQSVWESARAVAAEEAMRSFLPGYYDGPADAARHIIGTAELRCRAGFLVALGVVNGNEWFGQASGHGPELTAMDHANNAIGLAIGAKARSYPEVVFMARQAIEQGIATGGTGAGGTPVWLPQGRWKEPRRREDLPPEGVIEWRQREPGGGTYRFGGPEHGFFRGMTPREAAARLLQDLDAVPPEAWSEDDVRAVIRSGRYRNSWDPEHATWQARVRAHFDARLAREDAASDATFLLRGEGETEGGGVVSVAAYTRRGSDGPVRVSAHQRSAPD